MKVNVPMTITFADVAKRQLTGRIVAWEEEGNTSVGRTVFSKDSIKMEGGIKLLLEHDRTRPIGKLIDAKVSDKDIVATFQLAKTFAADDALEEAATGLRDGFSVGASINEWSNDKGVMRINDATLDEVSLVTDPAIDSARVSEVAASEAEEEKKEDSTPASADEDKPTEGEQVSDTTAPAPAVEEAVEAAKVEAAAPKPAFYTAPRYEFTKAKYLEASVRAKVLGDDAARQYVMAADDTTSNNAGLIPTRQLTELINPLSNSVRPALDSISTGVLPDAGMSFEIPKITAVPTVEDENEGDAIVETGMTNSFVTVNVNKYAGGQTFSVELLDRSSPVFFDILVDEMEKAYLKATEVAIIAGLVAGGTDGGNRTLDADGVNAFVADGAVSIYGATLATPSNILVTPAQWGNLMKIDDNGRPIYNSLIGNSNQAGNLNATSVTGNLLGLNLRVSTNLATADTDGDNSLIIINPASYTWYESSRFRLQTNVALNGQIEVAYYGYGALATKVGASAYRWMIA